MRSSAPSHLASFQQAFVQWRWPGRDQQRGSALHVAAALEKWLAQYPEHHATLQQLAVGAALNAVALQEWEGGERIASIGLNAALLGALSADERLASATMLALFAARSQVALSNPVAARAMINRAIETLQRMDAYAPLTSYLNLHRELLTAELEESSLEIASAANAYASAVEIISAILANRRRASELEGDWQAMTFGRGAQEQADAAHSLWQLEIAVVRRRAILGLGRTSSSADSARAAVRLCSDEGLPLADTVLALHGVLTKLRSDEVSDATDKLIARAAPLDERLRNAWVTGLRALQAEALLVQGDAAAALDAINSIESQTLEGTDVIALGLAFATRVRVTLSLKTGDEARPAVEMLIGILAYASDRLERTAYLSRFRAACGPALTAAARYELSKLQNDWSATRRRHVSVLLDALRAPDTLPRPLPPSSSPALRRAVRHATDRLGRLASAVAARGSLTATLVLIIQSVGDANVFICVGGDEDKQIAVTAASAAAQESLKLLTATADRAIHEATPALELEATARSVFDALPQVVRERILRAQTVIVVPDFESGQDRVPIELLHDGAAFLGMAKVIARCLSLSHTLRALEAPLVSPLVGRRCLCASVAAPPGLPVLKFAEKEIATVSDTLEGAMWDASPVFGSNAEPQTILELAPLANLVHIACHGDATAGAEALVLADGKHLSAADVATRHRLRGVVYLNACSVGHGRYLGGGLSRGVAYAFVEAGAPCVIANLLPVEDQGIAELSGLFYRASLGCCAGEAMRRARKQMQGRVSPALLTASIVIGNPFVRLSGDQELLDDQTSRLFRDVPWPGRLPAAGRRSGTTDPRFVAALEFARALRKADDNDLDALARVAHDLGHDVGEAFCWMTLADVQRAKPDRTALAKTLSRAIAALEPLRNVWDLAVERHQSARGELSALDPAYEPRKLTSFRTESGLSINDRSDPAVDATLRLAEAQQSHEAYWRGEPVLRVPDLDVASLAHNAVVWGYLNRVYDTGAEPGVAAAFAERLAWRGLVADGCVPHLARIFAGLLSFLWGKQKVQHLDHWMAEAHREVIAIAVARVRKYWTPPEQTPALNVVRDIEAGLDRMLAPHQGGSKFAQARMALRRAETGALELDQMRSHIQTSIDRLHRTDPFAAADCGAWILGDLSTRVQQATAGEEVHHELALTCKSLLSAFVSNDEGWYMPYLMDGFKDVRGGRSDVFERWSSAL